MPSTYTPIASQTLSTSAFSSVTFSSIPQIYTDLVLIANGTSDTNGTIGLRYNSDANNNYYTTYLNGSGSAATSGRQGPQNVTLIGEFYTANSTTTINLANYSNSNVCKTTIVRANTPTSGYVQGLIGVWASTSAINRIDLVCISGNFITGSTFTLYGIKAA